MWATPPTEGIIGQILLVGIAMLNIQGGWCDLKSVIRVFLLPKRFICETYSQVESRLDSFEARYFFGAENSKKRDSERGWLVGMDRNLPAVLMYRARCESGERDVQKLQPSFRLHPVSRGSASIDEYYVYENHFATNHIHEWACTSANRQARSQTFRLQPNAIAHSLGRFSRLSSLIDNREKRKYSSDEQPPFGPFEGCAPMWRVVVGFLLCASGAYFLFSNHDRNRFFWWGAGLFLLGSLIWLGGNETCDEANASEETKYSVHIEAPEYTLLNQGLIPENRINPQFISFVNPTASKNIPTRVRLAQGCITAAKFLVTANENVEVKTNLHDPVNGRQNSGHALKRALLCCLH